MRWHVARRSLAQDGHSGLSAAQARPTTETSMGTMQQIPNYTVPSDLSGAIEADVPASTMRDRVAKRIGKRLLGRMLEQRKAIVGELRAIPDRMQKVTNQARLMLELSDDFRSGRYRDISWFSIAIASACLVYAVSPSDVIPDFLPGAGTLDDMIVLTVATRLLEKDIRKYLSFKNYNARDYF